MPSTTPRQTTVYGSASLACMDAGRQTRQGRLGVVRVHGRERSAVAGVERLEQVGRLGPVDRSAAVLGAERNVLMSGDGSGKTTLVNALVSLLAAEGRVISVEGTLELRLDRANCLRFEARGLVDRGVTICDPDAARAAPPARSHRRRRGPRPGLHAATREPSASRASMIGSVFGSSPRGAGDLDRGPRHRLRGQRRSLQRADAAGALDEDRAPGR